MFVGAVPLEVVSQILTTVPFDRWGNVFVGCSGSFRVDRAIKKRHPSVRVYSNDVSLLTCSVGALAMKRSFDIRFKDQLQFVEAMLQDASFETRVAAVMVACAMGQYTGKNEFARSHFDHYRRHFADFTAAALPKLRELVAEVQIEEFYAGDFLQQIDRAAEKGGGFACFAPTYKNGYERIYRLVNSNTDWEQPQYGIWDPKRMPALLDDLDDRRIPYCVFSDQLIEGREPHTEFRGSNKPVWTYSSDGDASVRRRTLKQQPFKYTPVDPGAISAASKVQVCPVDNARMTYLKNVYLAKGIKHTTGQANFLVLIDGALVGGFCYAQSRFGDKTRELYLLSDFAISRERKLSKLVAMMATSREVIDVINRAMLIRVERVLTTAFTTNPVSMKYRGIFELKDRAADHLQYHSAVRELTCQGIFDEWLQKYGAQDNRKPPAASRRDGGGKPGRARDADRPAQAG